MNETFEPFSRTAGLIERGIAQGSHLGAQLYLSLGGQVVCERAFGQARLGVPMRTDTIVLWLSSVKPVTAVAVGQLWERGQLSLDDPVAKLVPEFGQGGKELITIRHLLTHTGGFRTADKCDLGASWPEIIDCICRTPLEPNWIPGARAGYHVASSWFVLGEIVRRIDGRPLEEYAAQEVFRRCGMDESWLVLPREEFHSLGDRLGLIYRTDKDSPSLHHRWNSEDDAAVCRPGRNGRGPIRELGRFYEALLRARPGPASLADGLVLKPETVREMAAPQRTGLFDDTFQHVIDWGLGFCVDSKRHGRETVPYGYGRFCSEETFGHSGAQSSCAFADPAHDLVVAWAFNGMPGERRHQERARELNSAIYQDLNLA